MNNQNTSNTFIDQSATILEDSLKDIKYSFGEDNEEDDIDPEDEGQYQPHLPSEQNQNDNPMQNGDLPNTECYSSKPDYTSSHLLTDNTYFNKDKSLETLVDYDIIITHSWDGNHYGPVSAWYDAFELWFMVQYNTLPQDLGGKRIALLFPDCPSKRDIQRILDAIFDKYHIDYKMFRSLCQHIYFINQPKEIIMKLGKVPYQNGYIPSNIVFIDGKLPTEASIQSDNIFLSIMGNLREEELILTKYNFLLIYTDKRINTLNDMYQKSNLGKNIKIAREQYPNTIVFDDIRRIDFSIFKKRVSDIKDEAKKDQVQEESTPKKRFLMYLTPKNRTPKWLKNDTETIKELDDILNALPDSALNKLGLEIRNNQKELYQDFNNFNKRVHPKNSKESKTFNPDQLEAIRVKGTIEGNGYTVTDVISEDPKAHIILAGLNEKDDSQVEFESILLARALTRGINISIEVYYQKDLPIVNIHSKYDYFIFTPAYKWTSSRFLPEAYWYDKKVIITKKALKSMHWNFPLNIRYNDAKNYLSFLAEDDVFKKPKSILARNLLDIW